MMSLPYLLWQFANDWVTWEWMMHGANAALRGASGRLFGKTRSWPHITSMHRSGWEDYPSGIHQGCSADLQRHGWMQLSTGSVERRRQEAGR